jgi:hypothetical protein
MTDKDDKKDSANISVGLSSQLIAASLTFVAILGGLITFVLDKKNPTTFFYILYVCSFIAFIGSIFCGGKGIQFVKKNGESGNWITKDDTKTNWFSLQSYLVLAGIIIVAFLPFIGEEKQPDDTEIIELKALIKESQKNDSILNVEIDKLVETINDKRVDDLESKLKTLEDEIIKLKKKK